MVILALDQPSDRAAVVDVCRRLELLMQESDVERVVVDVATIVEPDMVTVDALARLQVTARKHGRRICLRDASPKLLALRTLVGLNDVIPCES